MLNSKFNFNFWPSFADLMLSFVLVVLIILFVVSKMIAAGTENLDRARKSQDIISQKIVDDLGQGNVQVIRDNKLQFDPNKKVRIINKLDRQTITFSDQVLFDVNEAYLKTEGRKVLSSVGPVIKKNLDIISEIQVQGHADNDGQDYMNLTLAAQRAVAVYTFLQQDIGIDPSTHLMSITSFGKYKPVGREAGMNFNHKLLEEYNGNHNKKAQNRRIEIVLTYKNEKNEASKQE